MNKSDFYYSDGTPFHGIFKEVPMSGQWIKEEPKEPLYTIEDEDGELPSAHKIYMNSLNEYDAAMKLVPSWSYWKYMLKISVKIRRMIEEWREEKMLRDQMRAKAMLWEKAESGNLQAQRILYESKKEEAEIKKHEQARTQKESKERDVLESTFQRLKAVK